MTTAAGATPDRATLRLRLEVAIDRAIALLDAMDGDADIEAACEDEGFDSDTEWDLFENVPQYADDGNGGQDQRRIAGAFVGVEVSPLGVR